MPLSSVESTRARRRQRRLAVGGPCGSGKSRLAQFLASHNPDIVVIREPTPHRDVTVKGVPTPAALESFQRSFAEFRQSQASAAADRTLLFDRTFEEDREVFLPLYNTLGYLNLSQLKELKQLSIECENSVGSPDALVVLTASSAVLLRRLQAAAPQRPRWLVNQLELQCELYAAWTAKKSQSALIIDTSEIGMASVAAMAKQYFGRLDRELSA